jgi:TRAP-type C4-dicarboxylate transport system substrate-binding protein
MRFGMTILVTVALAPTASTAAAARDDAGAAKPIELKLSHWLPGSHPLHQAIGEWAASIAKASNGTLTVRIHPEGQLGKAFDHYDMARTGAVDLALANPGLQIGRFPIIEAVELPLLVSDGGGGSTALDAWYRAYAVREMGDVKFCLALVHEPGTLHSVNEPIVQPGDIDDLKIVAAQHTLAAFMTSLGGRIVRIAEAGLTRALVRSTARAAVMPWRSAIAIDVHTIAKHHLDLPLYVTALTLVMNPRSYARMLPAQQAVIDAHCSNPWVEVLAAPWANWERAGMAQMKTLKGHEVHVPTPQQLAQWRKAAEPLKGRWAAGVTRAGGDANAILEALQAQLTKRRSGF